jgi:hypothetical protein
MQKKNVRKLVKYWEQLMIRQMDTLFNNIKFLIMFHMGHIHIMLFIIQHIILQDTRYLQLWTM